MKTEINNENKARFFAQYYFQKVLGHNDFRISGEEPIGFSTLFSVDYYAKSNYYLFLTPLSLLTGEDAIECIMFSLGQPKEEFDGTAIDAVQYLQGTRFLDSDESDYLRSKGYAIRWMGLSVYEQIEAGWIKLKTN